MSAISKAMSTGELCPVIRSAAPTNCRKPAILLVPLRWIVFACTMFIVPAYYAQGFLAPTAGHRLGYREASTKEEIAAYLRATSAADWHDLRASGSITYPGGDTYSTTVYLMEADYSRMDVMLPNGTRSIRISRLAGRLEDEGRGGVDLPHANAGAGLVAFPRVWTQALTSDRVALADFGRYTVDGVALHRITMEYAPGLEERSRNFSTYATDLYFSPDTHLLIYSVDTISSSDLEQRSQLRVTEYGDYQRIHGMLVPMRIMEMVDGQPSWDLHLSEIETNTSPSTAIFEF